jgi:type I restriction enzyme M protein
MTTPTAKDRVLDPCCGTGGFLLHALDAVRAEANRKHKLGTSAHRDHWHDFAQRNLFGIEINRDIARVAKMNMIVHDDGHTNVAAGNSLESIIGFTNRNPGFKPASFDLILTNPPFGVTAKDVDIPTLKDDFKLFLKTDTKGGTTPLAQQKSEILFLERIWHFLKPKTGRAAVVVPDGILTNTSLQPVRDWLMARFQIIAAVGLPEEAFSHFGTGVKASILIIRKRATEEKRGNEVIFMAAPTSVGYNATGRKCENQLPALFDEFRRFQQNPSGYVPDAGSNASLPLSATDKLVFDTLKLGEMENQQTLITTIRESELDDALNPVRYINRFRESLFSGQRIRDVADALKIKLNPKKLGSEQLWDLVRIDDLPNNPIDVSIVRTQTGAELKGSFFEIEEGDILYARLGPTIINRKVVIFRGKRRRTLASPEFLVLRAKSGINALALFALLRCLSYRELAYSKTRGATPSRYRLSHGDMLKLPVPKMSDKAQQELAEEIEARRSRVQGILKQAKELWS